MSSQPCPVPAPKSELSPPRAQARLNFPQRVWDALACFRSVQLAIVLLSLMAMGVFIGVLMPQEGLVDVWQIKKQYGPTLYPILKAMGLFNVYSSHWFIALEVLFFFNLLFGSFRWLRPACRAAVQVNFCGPETIRATANHFALTGQNPDGLAEIARQLRQARYHVHQQGQRLYATKARWSRLGPAVAHLGILLLLISSVYGAFTGFKAQKVAVPGETFSLADATLIPNMPLPYWQGTIPDIRFRVQDFHIDYYPGTATPKQYFCRLQVLDGAGGNSTDKLQTQAPASQVVSVNHPLAVGDLTLYQASFAPTGKLFVEINGKPQTISLNTNFQGRPISLVPLSKDRSLMIFPFIVQQDPGVTQNHLRVFLRQGGKFLGAGPGKMPQNLKLTEGQQGQLADVSVKFLRPEIATGLQIKQAPEVPWMYGAYLIICLGTVMCIFSQRQLWVAAEPGTGGQTRFWVLYRTNKARISFLQELERLRGQWSQSLQAPEAPPPEPLQYWTVARRKKHHV